jgi:hypothetical protein
MKITTTESGVEIDFETVPARRCGECTLCCKLLPNVALDKRAGARCVHQRHGKGCAIYLTRPMECQTWSCRWLAAADETAGMSRPDRSHYVIDALPDMIRLNPNDGGDPIELQAMQIWIDPAFPATQNDAQLRAYMLKMAREYGMASLLRWSNRDGTAVFPPPLNADGEWHEVRSQCTPGFGLFEKLPKAFQDSLDKSR